MPFLHVIPIFTVHCFYPKSSLFIYINPLLPFFRLLLLLLVCVFSSFSLSLSPCFSLFSFGGMSISLDRARGVQVKPSGFSRQDLAYGSIFEALDAQDVDRGVVDAPEGSSTPEKEVEESNTCSSPSTSSSSSIGRNSDQSGRSSDDEDSGENEVQSSYKGPLDMMDSLEEVLPDRKGISKFYNGKSKSFTSLADASSVCIKDISKPENAYSKKRRNLLAFNLLWEKNRSFPLKNNGGGISKRPIGSSRSSLALAVAMSSSESNSSEDSNSSSYSSSPPPRPPLHPQSRASNSNLASIVPPQRSFSAWRSYSLADLQECATSASKANLANLN